MSMDLHLLALKWRWFTDIHSAMEFAILELLVAHYRKNSITMPFSSLCAPATEGLLN